MGNRYSLMALVDREANQSHGATTERGPAPVRETAKAFGSGLDQTGKHNVSYMTAEQATKLAQTKSTGHGHSRLKNSLSTPDLSKISGALMQDYTCQTNLNALGRGQGKNAVREMAAGAKPSFHRKDKGLGRSR